MRRMTAVMSSPMIGSRIGTPTATAAAAATTVSETYASARAWLPSATNAAAVKAPAGARPDLRCDPVAQVADAPRGGQRPERGRRTRVDQAADRLEARDERGDEDRRDDGQPRVALRPPRAQRECDPERDGGERVPAVVNEIRQQRHAPRYGKHGRLDDRCRRQHRKRQRDRSHPRAGALDRVVDETVAVTVPSFFMPVADRVADCAGGSATAQPMPMRTGVRVAVLEAAVPVRCRLVHRRHDTNAYAAARGQGSSRQALNCRTVLPSVMVGGLTDAVAFSLIHSAARREDSSVPALSWQTVAVTPPSPLRSAA